MKKAGSSRVAIKNCPVCGGSVAVRSGTRYFFVLCSSSSPFTHHTIQATGVTSQEVVENWNRLVTRKQSLSR
jgi:hypothetical protein